MLEVRDFPTTGEKREVVSMSRRGWAVSLTALAMATSILALIASLVFEPAPGVAADPAGGLVKWVLPGAPSWNDGIRAGQIVLDVGHGERPGDWQLVTTTGGVDYASPGSSHVSALRSAVPGALAALVLALLAATAGGRRTWNSGGSMAVLAIAIAAWPLGLTGHPELSSAGLLLGMLAPVGWSAVLVPSRLTSRLLVLASIIIATLWLTARAAFPDIYPGAEAARLVMGVGTTATILAVHSLPWRAWIGSGTVVDTSRVRDIVAVAAAAGGIAAFSLLLDLPVLTLAVAIGAAIFFMPPVRRRLAKLVDRLFFSMLREQSRIAAAEDERVRLAADLHDVPLQELSVVIRRLERVPGTDEEASLLRGVAQHLREITTELHPPVLRDLGLPPALRASAEDADRLAPPAVACAIEDRAGVLLNDRPPAFVELALFRIASEAITNARAHAAASTITVSGQVSRDEIAIAVEDDGLGIEAADVATARRAGHLGIASMEQRAEAIGAELRITDGHPGTTVLVRWRR